MSVRPLSPELARYDHLAGATRTGDGQVLLVLAVSGVVRRAVEVARAGAGTETGDARTVLVVDDAVTSRLLYRSVFEDAGWRVVLAADGEEALEIARGRKLDAIVSDVRMPRMDGLELTRRVRRLEGFRDLPIVLCSSLASDDDRREGLNAGATAYLVKGETPPAKVVDVLGSFVS
jgi:CheY-like chemotaxis protein